MWGCRCSCRELWPLRLRRPGRPGLRWWSWSSRWWWWWSSSSQPGDCGGGWAKGEQGFERGGRCDTGVSSSPAGWKGEIDIVIGQNFDVLLDMIILSCATFKPWTASRLNTTPRSSSPCPSGHHYCPSISISLPSSAWNNLILDICFWPSFYFSLASLS